MPLRWRTRYNIAVGTANGLQFIHSKKTARFVIFLFLAQQLNNGYGKFYNQQIYGGYIFVNINY